jgi:membrane-associated protein
MLQRRGMALIAAAQFVPGGRNVVMFSAGTLHYPLGRFLAAEAVGASLWAAFQTAIGYVGGQLFDDTLTSLLVSLGIAFAIGGLIELADRLMRSARARAASGSGG